MENGSNNPSILDLRRVPFWHRLPMILSAVGQLPADGAFELIVDLDPWPLRIHLESTSGGKIDWRYLESGPEVWRIRLSRRS